MEEWRSGVCSSQVVLRNIIHNIIPMEQYRVLLGWSVYLYITVRKIQ